MPALPIIRKSYLAKLGDYVFEADSAPFDKLSRKTSYRWAKQQHVGKLRSLQFLGPDDDTITLSGTFYPHYRGGLEQMDKLRTEAGKGKPLLLVYTDKKLGQNLGKWVIKSINENRSILLGNGAPKRIDFTIEILKYDSSTPA